MFEFIRLCASFLAAVFKSRAGLQTENLALRHQLCVYQRSVKRPKVKQADRIIWTLLAKTWAGWKDALIFVKPDTVIRWQRVKNMGIEEVLTAPHSPWKNPYSERLNGSVRRECLDHVIVFSENHLRRLLADYVAYYNESRTHLSLEMDSPVTRLVQVPNQGKVVSLPQVGGLHHRYERHAA